MIDKEFVVYSRGPVYCSVCTSLSAEEAEARLNATEPTGLDSLWSLADEDFVDGIENGIRCQKSETHRHWLFSC
jgi:hypothetical protein